MPKENEKEINDGSKSDVQTNPIEQEQKNELTEKQLITHLTQDPQSASPFVLHYFNSQVSLEIIADKPIVEVAARILAFASYNPMSRLQELTIYKNSFSDDAVEALATGLKQPGCSLKALSLAHNIITQRGVGFLAEALQFSTTLTKLNLEDNPIGDSGATALANAFKRETPSPLVILILKQNGITNSGAAALARALTQPQCFLQELYLDKNKIDDQGVSSLVNALEKNSSLKCLQLFENPIREEGAQLLTNVLKVNHTLYDFYPHSDEYAYSQMYPFIARNLAEGVVRYYSAIKTTFFAVCMERRGEHAEAAVPISDILVSYLFDEDILKTLRHAFYEEVPLKEHISSTTMEFATYKPLMVHLDQAPLLLGKAMLLALKINKLDKDVLLFLLAQDTKKTKRVPGKKLNREKREDSILRDLSTLLDPDKINQFFADNASKILEALFNLPPREFIFALKELEPQRFFLITYLIDYLLCHWPVDFSARFSISSPTIDAPGVVGSQYQTSKNNFLLALAKLLHLVNAVDLIQSATSSDSEQKINVVDSLANIGIPGEGDEIRFSPWKKTPPAAVSPVPALLKGEISRKEGNAVSVSTLPVAVASTPSSRCVIL